MLGFSKSKEKEAKLAAQQEAAEKERQEQCRIRGNEIMNALSIIANILPYSKENVINHKGMTSTIDEEIMKEELFREVAQSMWASVYNAPIFSIDMEAVDASIMNIISHFKKAIVSGDIETAKFARTAVYKAITDIRNDVADHERLNAQEWKESKENMAAALESIVKKYEQLFTNKNTMAALEQQFNVTKAKVDSLYEQYQQISREQPGIELELKKYNNKSSDFLSVEAQELRNLLNEIVSLNKTAKITIAKANEIKSNIQTLKDSIELEKSNVKTFGIVVDRLSLEETERLQKEAVAHHAKVQQWYTNLDEATKHAQDEWLTILKADPTKVQSEHQEFEEYKREIERLAKNQEEGMRLAQEMEEANEQEIENEQQMFTN